MPSTLTRRRAAVIALLVLLPAAVLAAGTALRPAGPAPAVWVTPAAPPVPPPLLLAGYDFDGPRPWDDVSRHGHHLTPFGGNRARPRRVPHGAGRAVQFPRPCDREPCPRLILRVPSTPALNPGAAPFSYGATVRLSARDTTAGQNVLQKGYAAEGSQYKLQIDGRRGHPSCVMRGEDSRAIHVALAPIGVADGDWHRLECRRTRTDLILLVDGSPHAAVRIPPGLRVDNAMSLNIGGKSAHAHNDQFHGAVDDIFLSKP
ncbi:LamG domain-containing protein [Actinoplanes sp. NPDC049802]|uniref:LamG domain-containing protein n=1 Tax=Actinoplanes sp. NPDC049802 TaxID=3154742 RepID=UPI0033D22AD8